MMQTHNDDPAIKRLQMGTSGRGTFRCAYAILTDVFGPPDLEGSQDNKIDALWVLCWKEDGLVATIYNYKTSSYWLGADALPLELQRGWNIGGNRPEAFRRVIETLPPMSVDSLHPYNLGRRGHHHDDHP